MCISEDELTWIAFPSGARIERVPLPAPVRGYFTGPNVGPGEKGVVYFLAEKSAIYRWTPGGGAVPVLEEDPEPRPPFSREEYSIVSRDGRSVPVQRFIPPDPRLPAILYVHGGPGELIDPDDPIMLRLLAERYEFVCAAYRGSAGYGPENRNANRGEYGRADV